MSSSTRIEIVVDTRPKGRKSCTSTVCPIEPHTLCLFFCVKDTFFTDKKLDRKLAVTMTAEQFVNYYAKKKEIGKYFHNELGPAYGALYRDLKTNEIIKVPHAEFWQNGKRLLKLSEIKSMLKKAKGSYKV